MKNNYYYLPLRLRINEKERRQTQLLIISLIVLFVFAKKIYESAWKMVWIARFNPRHEPLHRDLLNVNSTQLRPAEK